MPAELHPTVSAFLRALAAHMARQEAEAGDALMDEEGNRAGCNEQPFTRDIPPTCNPKDRSMTSSTSAAPSRKRKAIGILT